VPITRNKTRSFEAEELSDLSVSKKLSFGLSEAPFRGVEHAWKPQALMHEMHFQAWLRRARGACPAARH